MSQESIEDPVSINPGAIRSSLPAACISVLNLVARYICIFDTSSHFKNKNILHDLIYYLCCLFIFICIQKYIDVRYKKCMQYVVLYLLLK